MGYYTSGVKVLGIMLLILTIACGSSGNTSYAEDSLKAKINAISGVHITGTGDYARVIIRARKLPRARKGQGFEGEAEDGYRDSYRHPPLFVVNGQVFGRDFKELRNLLRTREIDSVKLLPYNMALQYGKMESYYGVIAITTKKSNDSQKGS